MRRPKLPVPDWSTTVLGLWLVVAFIASCGLAALVSGSVPEGLAVPTWISLGWPAYVVVAYELHVRTPDAPREERVP